MNLFKKILIKLGIFSMADLIRAYNLGKEDGFKDEFEKKANKIMADFFERKVNELTKPDET